MERIQSINPDRIAWCCADYGMTADALAAEVKIAPATMARLMEGEDAITFAQLTKIAEYFGRGVLFFLDSSPVNDAEVHTPAFRTLANQKPELSAKVRGFIERAERQRAVYMSLREEIQGANVHDFAPPQIPQDSPADAARVVRAWLGLGLQNSFDTYRAAVESRGVLVFRSNGYQGKWQIAKESPILGFALYDPTCPLIVVKKQQWDAQQSFTLMHELGHLLLHKASSIDDERDMYSHGAREKAANAFAGHLLVPDAYLQSVSDFERPNEVGQYDDWLAPQRKAWGVSGEVILRRLMDAGRLPRARYQAYRDWRAQVKWPEKDGGNRGFRHREPKHIFGDVFVRTVLDALSGRYITLAKASRYLDGLKINDLHELERHYAGL